MPIPPDARPLLAPKVRLRVDRHSGKTMLLYPERGLALNETAREIVARCTGRATVADIVAEIVAEKAALPGAPAAEALRAEVVAFLEALADRGLLRWSAP